VLLRKGIQVKRIRNLLKIDWRMLVRKALKKVILKLVFVPLISAKSALYVY
jgi:hypothetical protein